MGVESIKDYREYLKCLRDTFGNIIQMPPLREIESFIFNYSLDTDWDISVDDVRKDITKEILIEKQSSNNFRKKSIFSYKQYLEKLKDIFGIPEEMPDDKDIEAFIDEYNLDDMWDIAIGDIKEDLEGFITGNYNDMYSDAVKKSPKPKSAPVFVSKTVFQTYVPITSSHRTSTALPPVMKTKPVEEDRTKKNNTAGDKKQGKQETIFLDGDNHIDEGQKGIEHTPKNTKVRAIFSQSGAKLRFDRKYGGRSNVSSKLIKPGDQAVDNQIKTEAGQLLKNGNQDITIVSQDSDFVEFRDRKKNEGFGNRISTAKSVNEKLNRNKKK